MEEQKFKDQFITTFLATWCANEYADACMCGNQDRLSHPPVEDAQFLAKEAWLEWRRHNPEIPAS